MLYFLICQFLRLLQVLNIWSIAFEFVFCSCSSYLQFHRHMTFTILHLSLKIRPLILEVIFYISSNMSVTALHIALIKTGNKIMRSFYWHRWNAYTSKPSELIEKLNLIVNCPKQSSCLHRASMIIKHFYYLTKAQYIISRYN